jgi:2-polyprenyl-6-hydroxyphenyl methylase/3-demethylubiquinone-9 3-methyltransferase
MQMHDYVSKYDELAHEEAAFNIPLRKEYVLRQIGRGKRVLDVGCLGGQFSLLMIERGNQVWGVEINPTAAEVAQRRGVRVKVADVEDGLPFADEFFDVVHAGGLIEQLYDTKAFFDECCRVLRPGGFVLFTAANLNSLENRLRIAAGGYLAHAGAYPEDHHGARIRVFNAEKVRELCAHSGLELADMRGVFNLERRARWIEAPLRLAARVAPQLSKLLIFKAVEPGPAR